MIYMVELDMPHPAREPEWHDWYMQHIHILLTVPGFRASQRFRAIAKTPAPFLALHEVESGDLFESADYRGRGGPTSTGEWQHLHTNWQRNLLAGIDETPQVAEDEYVLLVRDEAALPLPEPADLTWLTGEGLDGTIDRLGFGVIRDPAPFMGVAERDPRVCIYRPISRKIRSSL